MSQQALGYLPMLSFFILSFDIILSLDILSLDIVPLDVVLLDMPVVLFFCIAPPGSGEPLLLESLVEGIDDDGFDDVVGVCANAPTVAKAEIAAAQLVIIIAFLMTFLRFLRCPDQCLEWSRVPIFHLGPSAYFSENPETILLCHRE